nr:vegetative cell wall protein gp1-like [Aegilops tauschii subsp. strangulata]
MSQILVPDYGQTSSSPVLFSAGAAPSPRLALLPQKSSPRPVAALLRPRAASTPLHIQWVGRPPPVAPPSPAAACPRWPGRLRQRPRVPAATARSVKRPGAPGLPYYVGVAAPRQLPRSCLRRPLARAPVIVRPCDATSGVSSAAASRAGRPLAPPTGLAPLGRLPCRPVPVRVRTTRAPAPPRARPCPAPWCCPAPGRVRRASRSATHPRTSRLRVPAGSPPPAAGCPAPAGSGSSPGRLLRALMLAPAPCASHRRLQPAAAPGRLRPARAWRLLLRRPPAPPPPVAGSRVPAPPANPATRRSAGSASPTASTALGRPAACPRAGSPPRPAPSLGRLASHPAAIAASRPALLCQ